jgi:hypothetical protein
MQAVQLGITWFPGAIIRMENMFVLINTVVISRLSHIYRMGEKEEYMGRSSMKKKMQN